MRILSILLLSFTLVSCDLLENVDDLSLTESEVASGLREALRVGTDTATTILGLTDGYYKDKLVKILLPEEANIILDNIKLVPGGAALVENVILGINRSAEDAAKEAGPIFKEAIVNITITDAFTILKGDSVSATRFLRTGTYDNLYALYNPKIQKSLDKKLLGTISTNDAWKTLTQSWNLVAGSIAGQVAGLKTVNTDLDAHLTNKALDGLFLKVASEEKDIRQDPLARVNDILKRVFGS